MGITSGSRRARGLSPVVGVALLIVIVILLAVSASYIVLGLGQETVDEAETTPIYDDDRCAGDQVLTFEGDMREYYEQISDNPCALWLDAERVETDGSGRVKVWPDLGPDGFDGTQPDPNRRPEYVDASSAPGGIDAPVVKFDGEAPLRSGYDLGDDIGDESLGIRDYSDGDYVRIDRPAEELGVDEDTGMVVATVIYTESFDRGGTWTIGKAGKPGAEFSMRTCGADRTYGDCPSDDDPVDHWRAQHWDRADVDFEVDSHREWIVLIHAYDGEETTIRVDGKEIASARTNLDLSDNRDVQIGRWERTSGDPDFYYHGYMAELLVFDRALEEEELEGLEAYFDREYGVVDT